MPRAKDFVIFVLPTSDDESRRYLAAKNISSVDVRQGSLQNLKVRGTPTILLIDGSGTVRSAWIGQLSPATESQVQTALESLN